MSKSINTHILRPERTDWYQDGSTGRLVTSKRYDEVGLYSIDLTERLATGETLATVTMLDTSGPQIVSVAVSGTVLSMTVGKAGTATVRLTTTMANRVMELALEWRASDRNRGDAYARQY